MNKAVLLTTLAIILGLLSTKAYASQAEGIGEDGHDLEDNQIELQIENHSQNENEEDKNDDQNEFSLSGDITAVADDNSSFVVLGKTILIDTSKVKEFKQKGILEVGQKVKVEGEIIDTDYYAEEINVIGTGQGRFKIEVSSEDSEEEVSPTPSVSVSPTPSGVTPTPSTSTNPLVNFEVKAQGTVEQVTAFFQQILDYLKGLL